MRKLTLCKSTSYSNLIDIIQQEEKTIEKEEYFLQNDKTSIMLNQNEPSCAEESIETVDKHRPLTRLSKIKISDQKNDKLNKNYMLTPNSANDMNFSEKNNPNHSDFLQCFTSSSKNECKSPVVNFVNKTDKLNSESRLLSPHELPPIGRLRRVFTTHTRRRKKKSYGGFQMINLMKEPLRVVHSVPLTIPHG